ncbi:GNAT family N-acetyltransferase [Nocardia macrotermitis]|uniref:Putative N-acetyltransferase YsnE n=1 Tax=Nocardia macrotermitis TaxID=2585198 RepID=A0A7K0D694_9NOCA|nr:GNAT family N-acetyltransferase [Nocardia macrotermitis]MQY21247.1 putative N-acetyltransferase YsnE [Nocardia macrotermitis]
MEIRTDDLTGQDIVDLIGGHLDEMRVVTPNADSMHALDVDALRRPDITVWSVREDGRLAGCGAIKRLDAHHGEIKSMRTAHAHRRRGVAALLLAHLETESARVGITRLSLETGAEDFFEPARRLYLGHGFEYCEPFGDYRPDPLSVFMTKRIA